MNEQLQAQKLFAEQCISKWKPVLDCAGVAPIKDQYKRATTAIMLENQERALNEAAPTNAMGSSSSSAGNYRIYDPVLISMVRRSAPKLMAFDIAGVQPMTGPTGLVFALKAHYKDQNNAEALFNEANTSFSAENSSNTWNFGVQQTGTNPADATMNSSNYTVTSGMTTAELEALGGATGQHFQEMSFSIASLPVAAVGRALKAEFTDELVQDMKAVHGLDAEAELSNILTTEILAELNRELIRSIYITATVGAQNNVASAGTFNLDVDSNGRWMVEKFKGLYFQIEREANAIAQATRRGKGNWIICSSDLASALQLTGQLDYNPALQQASDLEVDDTGSTFAGVLGGRYKVYIDPYIQNSSNYQMFVVGYKGSSPFDAGIFYCPYVPLYMVRAIGENTFQPKLGFKTRYGMVAHPFANANQDGVINFAKKNAFFRRVNVSNLA